MIEPRQPEPPALAGRSQTKFTATTTSASDYVPHALEPHQVCTLDVRRMAARNPQSAKRTLFWAVDAHWAWLSATGLNARCVCDLACDCACAAQSLSVTQLQQGEFGAL